MADLPHPIPPPSLESPSNREGGQGRQDHVEREGTNRFGPDRAQNLRLALILASIALAFFVGIVLKFIFFPHY